MATTVEIGVYLTTGDAPYFRLNDAVKGKLDNVSYRLAGPIFYDITNEVRNVSVKRGKNRELDRYNAGNATVSLNNQTRLFDPLNTDSTFYGNIIPRRQIRIRSGGYNQFIGLIEDWNLEYDVSGQSLASITASDGFTLLAQQSLTPGTATAQKTGARINAVLSQPSVAWPLADRIIDTGNSDLGADVFDGNVLNYLQKVEASEQGQFFINRDGYIRFVNGAVTPTSSGAPLFSDAGDGIPYVGATVQYGTELLYNSVEVTYPAGTAVAVNISSQNLYGISSTSVDTLLSGTTGAESLADYWVARYGQPDYRFEAIDINVSGLPGTYAETVLQLELGDVIQMKFTPNGIGSAIDRYLQVTSIDHNVNIDQHITRIGVSSLQFSFLVLDDDGFGILDENALAF